MRDKREQLRKLCERRKLRAKRLEVNKKKMGKKEKNNVR
jgi:hypothetical protein